MVTKHFFWFALSGALAAMAVGADAPRAQLGLLPALMQEQLQAANANLGSIVINLAQNNPQYATQLLQAGITLLGNSSAGGSLVKSVADLAQSLSNPGSGSNPALAAALAIAVENALTDPQNAALIAGAGAGLFADANAETNLVLQNANVQQAILDHAPGTQGQVQAANGLGAGGAFGTLGGGGPTGSSNGSSPAR